VEDDEKEHGTKHVEKHGIKMVSFRVKPINMTIKHVGHPRQGVPVAGVRRGKRPLDVFNAQSGIDVWVFHNIDVVVEDNKMVVLHLPEHRQNQDGKKETDYERDLAVLTRVLHTINP
jgi:hypothetical protein